MKYKRVSDKKKKSGGYSEKYAEFRSSTHLNIASDCCINLEM